MSRRQILARAEAARRRAEAESVVRVPSRALPMVYYRDPLEVLLQEEAATCAGCAHEGKVLGRLVCGKNRRYGKRCKLYVEA